MKIVFICILLVFYVAIVCTKPVPQRGDGSNGLYYPSFWFSRTNYNRYNRYRYAKLLENLKRRSSTISYAEIGSAWGR